MINNYLTAIGALLHSPLIIMLCIVVPLLVGWTFMVDKRDGWKKK